MCNHQTLDVTIGHLFTGATSDSTFGWALRWRRDIRGALREAIWSDFIIGTWLVSESPSVVLETSLRTATRK